MTDFSHPAPSGTPAQDEDSRRRTPPEPPITWPQALRTVTAAVIVFAAGGAVGAYAWQWAADPPTYPADYAEVAGQPYPDPQGMSATFNVDGTFLIIALALGAVLGFGCAALFRSYGVVTVVSVVIGSFVGYLVMRHLGFELGPAPLETQAAQASPGDTLHGPLRVKASGIYFMWPVGAVAGALVALALLAPPAAVHPGGPRVS